VNLDPAAAPLAEFLGGIVKRVAPLGLSKLHYFATRVMTSTATGKSLSITISTADTTSRICHKALSSVLDYKQYTIENEDRFCSVDSHGEFRRRRGHPHHPPRRPRLVFLAHPNFMFNCYEGYLDTNLVIPIDVDHCRVIFDFYFSDVSEAARAYNEQSVAVGNRVQTKILASVKPSSAA